MSTQVPPKKNAAFSFTCQLVSQANVNIFQSNPTLATGDVKVEIDSGSANNITSLPTVLNSGTTLMVSLTASEMNGDNITVKFHDAAGDEWCDFSADIQTTARYIDDLAWPTTSGRSLDITTTGGAGIDWGNVENQSTSVNLSGTSTKAVEPTVAGRTLDITATGAAGIDWGNVENPTTTINFTNTTVGNVTLTATATTLTQLTTQLADSIATDGSRPTYAQALLMLTRFLMERSVSGLTMTVKKEDGTTANMTFTLNDSSNPTSITRAS